MTRYLLCQAHDLADSTDEPASFGRPRAHLTLLPPPPVDEIGAPRSAGPTSLSLALLRALDRLNAPGPLDGEAPDNDTLSPELADTEDELPESERPTRRYTVPGTPPHMRATLPAEA
jgi:hypothetical protein